MKLHKAVLIVAMSVLSTQAWADLHKGVYLGAGYGIVSSNVTTQASRNYTVQSTLEKDKSSTGVKVYGGYTRGNFGVEMGYYSLGSYDYAGTNFGTYTSDRYESSAIALMATGSVALSEAVALHGKLGLGRMRTRYTCVALCTGFDNNTVSSIVPVIGLGASWGVLKNLALRADLESFRGGKFKYGPADLKANYELYTVSAELRF